SRRAAVLRGEVVVKPREGIVGTAAVEAHLAEPLLELLERPASAVVRDPVVLADVDSAGLSQVELRSAARPVREELVRDGVEVGGFEPGTAQEATLVGTSLRRDPGRA